MNKLRINKIGILSAAKMHGVMGFVIGLLIGILYALIILLYTVLGASIAKGDAALAIGGGGIVVAIIALVAFPIMYGILGFIGGVIWSVVYNVFAKFVGGIEIEVESIA